MKKRINPISYLGWLGIVGVICVHYWLQKPVSFS